MNWLGPNRRKWLYGVVTAAMPILVSYGVVADAQAPLWAALGAAVLGTGTAAAHTRPEA